jgi:hypothetical protein
MWQAGAIFCCFIAGAQFALTREESLKRALRDASQKAAMQSEMMARVYARLWRKASR